MTWNLAGALPEHIPERAIPKGVHVVVVGAQECMRSARAGILQPNHKKFDELVLQVLGERFTLVSKSSLQAIHIAVFATTPVQRLISDVQTQMVPTGVSNVLGNKGAVAVSMLLGKSRLCFVSCHLASGQKAFKARVADVNRINSGLLSKFAWGASHELLSNACDALFWLGDLNFRVDASRDLVEFLLSTDNHKVRSGL